jgi:hypothetical protein
MECPSNSGKGYGNANLLHRDLWEETGKKDHTEEVKSSSFRVLARPKSPAYKQMDCKLIKK